MKRILFILTGILLYVQQGHAQQQAWMENFDGNVSYTVSSGTWGQNSAYYVSSPQSYRGEVPKRAGEVAIIQTPAYDFRGMNYVFLRFNQICKVSPHDITQIQYRFPPNVLWEDVPYYCYEGSGNYRGKGFDAASYPEWRSDDSTIYPQQSWWKEESFDLSSEVKGFVTEFRFVITRGNTLGTNVSYGWLLDNVEITASTFEIKPPIVELISALNDTVYSTGPFTIRANVESTSGSPLLPVWLKYSATKNGVTQTGSVQMQRTTGNIYEASIPRYTAGTKITYSVTAEDGVGNNKTAAAEFVIAIPVGTGVEEYAIVGTGVVTNYQTPMNLYYQNSWTRQIYLASEISSSSSGGIITELAWDFNYTAAFSVNDQRCYFKAIPATTTTVVSGYVDPIIDGATLVWSGTYSSVAGPIWANIVLDKPFSLPPGYNLMVYWLHEHGPGYPGSDFVFNHTTTPTNMTIYAQQDAGGLPISSTGTRTTARPNARFFINDPIYHTNSAELVSLESPIVGQVVAGTSTPITVTFKNKGSANLTSLDFGWSINGQVQPTSAAWTGNLDWDYSISGYRIDNYTPLGGYDTIRVWCTLPNGQMDSVLKDDTLSIIVYGCDATMGGIYSVGPDNANYTSVQEVIDIIKLCTPARNITLNLQSGIYNENWDFTGVENAMGDYTMRITSLRNHKDSVVLQPDSGVVAVLLGKTNNVVFENITIKASENAHAVQFINACTNIVINNCNILLDSISSDAYYSILKNSGTGLISNVYITNNYINGGYGINFYGGTGTTAYGSHFVFDNNTLNNAYYSGGNFLYMDSTSICHNKIIGREANVRTNGMCRGLLVQYCNGSIIGNKIIQRSPEIHSYYGMHLVGCNSYNTSQTGAVVNNEIIIFNGAENASYGMDISTSKLLVAHNSILVAGVDTISSRGLFLENNASSLTIKNNNILLSSNVGFPIYLDGLTYLSQWDINSNNYYAPQYIGYYSSDSVTDPAIWRQTITSDINSVRIAPDFIDSTSSLEMNDYTGLNCTYIRDFNYDIENAFRSTITTIGCYNGVAPLNGDIELTQILYFTTGGSVPGSTKSVSLEIFNPGATTVTNASFGWVFNNGIPNTATYNGSIASGQYDTVPLGAIIYIPGYNDLTAYLSNGTLNNNSLPDQYSPNDTIIASVDACYSLSGRQVIGSNNADFETIADFFTRASFCGVSSDIELAYQDGNYTITNIVVENYMTVMNGHKLTITSLNADPAAVKFKVSSGVAFTLANVRNFVLDAVTIDVTSGTYGIQFTNTCSNVVISNCEIYANPTTTSSSYAPIYKSTTGILDGITIVNNILDGGYYGINLYGAPNADAYGTNIRIDSNTITNTYYYGIYLQYADFKSISNNKVFSRTGTANVSTTYWSGLYFLNSNGLIINGNIVRQLTPTITYPRGLYLSSMNITNFKYPAFPDTLLVSNNEIYAIMGVSSTANYAISVVTSRANIINNTFYGVSNGITGGYCAYFPVNNDYYLGMKNNIFIQLSSAGWPVYINGTFPGQWDFNANLLYSGGTNVGYVGSAKTTLATWRSSVPTDTRSVSLMSNFIDIPSNFGLLDTVGLAVPAHSLVSTDILNLRRGSITNMGAYRYEDPASDVQPEEILLQTSYSLGDLVPIDITIKNTGANVLSSAMINWTVNGGALQSKQWTGSLAHGAVSSSLNLETITANRPTEIIVYTTLPNGTPDPRTYNDTMVFSFAVCDTALNGTYTVGSGGNFGDMNVAWLMIDNCGINGAVTLSLLPGTHTMNNKVVNKISGTSASKRITITSSTGNKDDVTIYGSFTLNGVENMTFKNITIDNSATPTQSTILFVGTCTDIEIRGCNIMADTTTTSATVHGISYHSVSGSTDRLNGVRIVNNTMDGGHSNIYFYYATGGSSYMACDGVTIDSNTLTNAYANGIYTYYYGYSPSVSYNTITTRVVATTQYGIYWGVYSTVDAMNNNRIFIRGTSTSYGIYTYYINRNTSYNAKGNAPIYNNEIIIPSAGTNYGFYMTYPNVDLYHNSVYLGGSSQCNGIYVTSMSNTHTFNVKNNLFVTATSAATGYPIYFSPANLATVASGTTLDYNNYFSTGANIAYLGSAVPSMPVLRASTGQDANSKNYAPTFKNIATSTELADTCRIDCPVLTQIPKDIRGFVRKGTTNMGAYGYEPYSLDAELSVVNTSHMPANVPSTPSVVVYNGGKTTITDLTIGYSFNDGADVLVPWTGSLAFLDEVLIDLPPTVTPILGNNQIKVWIVDVNQQGIDDDQGNDTIQQSFSACTHVFYNNSYVIGNSGSADFKTLDSAFNKMVDCGIKGNVTLLLENGTYTENLTFLKLLGLIPDGSTLTITSLTGNTNDVTIKPLAGAAITFFSNQNITIKNITIDVSSSGHSYGIVFNGACENIEIYGCNILSYASATGNAYAGIYSPGATHLRNIRIIKNTINGGYYGIYMQCAPSTSTIADSYNSIIDSNVITNPYSTGMEIAYGNITSISHNTIQSRANASATFYGIYMNYFINCSEIVGNKIYITYNPTSTSNYAAHGLRTNCLNYSGTSTPCLVANNEIRITGTMGTAGSTSLYQGISTSQYNRMNIYNNSIFITAGYQPCYGISKYNSAPSSYLVNTSHNNIAINSLNEASYPLHAAGAYLHPVWGVNDYNNYYNYNGPYIAFAGEPYATIEDVRNEFYQDLNSCSYNPLFADSTINLDLSLKGFANLLFSPHPEVLTDIRGKTRGNIATLGAYDIVPEQNAAMAIRFVNWENEVIDQYTQNVEVSITNLSSQPVSGAMIEWTINGVPRTAVPFNPAIPLSSLSTRNIVLGNYQVLQPVNEVRAWLSNISGSPNTLKDTAVAISNMVQLVEYIEPLVWDTINSLAFNVYARIKTGTGAPVSIPQLIVKSTVNNKFEFNDTVDMNNLGGESWIANIPSQYYGSKIIYSLTVEDTVGNIQTIIDSTYLAYKEIKDSIVVGTGKITNYYTPIYYSNYGWSRQIYLGREINPTNQEVIITKLAWESSNLGYIYSNQICYMRLVHDSVYTSTAYIDPASVGATEVYRGSYTAQTGWSEVTLQKPFVLPPNMNVEIFWLHQGGSGAGSSYYWLHTFTPQYRTLYYGTTGSSFATGTGTYSYDRPNARFMIEYPLMPYAGYNLGLMKVIEPFSDPSILCYPNYSPVKVAVTNLGSDDYNFGLSPLRLDVEVTGAINFAADTTVRAGTLKPGETDTIDITTILPIMLSGKYEIKAWLTNNVDIITYDDTIVYEYISGRIGLPVDEYFSDPDLPLAFISKQLRGSKWEVINGSSPVDTTIKPGFGTGMLSFIGTRGCLTELSTRQLDLYGSTNPKMEFWYFHDTIPSEDYTDVLVTLDGGLTHTKLLELVKYNSQRGWHHYTVSLSNYMTESCVILVFESMIMSDEGEQYIDRIWITSEQDMAVSEILMSELSACNLDKNELRVVIESTKYQSIDFSQYPGIGIQVEISGPTNHNFNYPLRNKVLEGFSFDTLFITSDIDFTAGTYTIKAYLTSPVDNYHVNDTAKATIIINPSLSVTIKPVSGGSTNCISGNLPIKQQVVVKNIGNMDLSDINLRMDVTSNSLTFSAMGSISDTLLPGDSITYNFDEFTTPWDATYYVDVTAFLDCDSILAHASAAAIECVNIEDLYVFSIDNPSEEKDKVGDEINIIATIINRSDINAHSNISIYAEVTNMQGNILHSFEETISHISFEATVPHNFREIYTVPADTAYMIKVYIENRDNYAYNDSLTITRKTDYINKIEAIQSINISMEQNIPNPANTSTMIRYNVPESGDVIFSIHSINGQLLHNKVVQSEAGTNTLELNISSLSAGIYMYSMEYKGQRIVKRMSIKR